MHKESLNPFTDSRARMVWLGVAVDVVGFGAMGASMQLAFIAGGKGKIISDALKVIVNSVTAAALVKNSTSLTSGYVELLKHLEKLSDEEIVYIYLQSIFLEKGLFFTYLFILL